MKINTNKLYDDDDNRRKKEFDGMKKHKPNRRKKQSDKRFKDKWKREANRQQQAEFDDYNDNN